MPTGQEIGEPKVEYRRDDAARLATVTVTNLVRRHQTPHAVVHPHKDGKAPRIEISNVHEDSLPETRWDIAEDGHPESLTVSGICLRRCADEPGRMSDVDIECHALHMAAIAIHDRIAELRTTPAQRAAKIAEAEAALAKLRGR